MKTTACILAALFVSIVCFLPARADENQLNLEVVVNYTKAIETGNFQQILNYVSFLSFSAKLYGDKNVFPWMGEYPTLSDYADVVLGYEGIINQTSSSIDWIFSNDGKVMGSGLETGMCVNGKNFSVSKMSVMTVSGGLITMREDWFDTSMFYERCFCAGVDNYLTCPDKETKRSLVNEEQARSASETRNVASDPSTALGSFLNELSNTSTLISEDFVFSIMSVAGFPIGADTTGLQSFGEWELTKNEYVASIAYNDVFTSYISLKTFLTANANFTMMDGTSVSVPMIAYGEFNEAELLSSVKIVLDTYELGKAL